MLVIHWIINPYASAIPIFFFFDGLIGVRFQGISSVFAARVCSML